VAAVAIAWGKPVLASSITTVFGGQLFYRGHDAARLAETETLEGVARLLRGGGIAQPRDRRPRPLPARQHGRERSRQWQIAQRSMRPASARRLRPSR